MKALLRRESVGGALLVIAAAVALIWANSPWAGGYETFILPMHPWAADGLLVIFFFIVGNELKQEFVRGELRHPRRAVLPIVASICGAVVPALIFAAITFGQEGAAAGWGIPMATDIAFAVSVLAVVGRGLPPALRTFLLTLAIVDDLVAIIVIAVFYSAGLAWAPLLGAIAGLALFGWLQRGPMQRGPMRRGPMQRGPMQRRLPMKIVLIPLAVLVWYLMHESGIHATIAGVALGLLMRTSTLPGETTSPSDRAEHLIRPWTTALILPIFALTSAGVTISGAGDLLTHPAALGILAGLIVGKIVGITGGAWLTTRFTRAELHPDLTWPDIFGIAQLAGIGFTVSLLIAELSYPNDLDLLESAKAAVLLASGIAATLATITLTLRAARHRRRAPDPAG
ncbi:NhaA family Na+:H+ antiporter [Actinoplanes lutulentus]|uniref:Na+/H+ antiporter NhaA n=1 Tax=Actinoplanes lutulentus TaxID=1287878 RepID=UPI0018157EF3|nr:Na+/H+ antiporter NhaA [Actinoplanes lutulentus]MBB2947068.1 NhaA family Na+:H+ antiporter [Actinoplanes lutulentus]